MSQELDISRQRREGGVSVIAFHKSTARTRARLRRPARRRLAFQDPRLPGQPATPPLDRPARQAADRPRRHAAARRGDRQGPLRRFSAFDDKDLLRRFWMPPAPRSTSTRRVGSMSGRSPSLWPSPATALGAAAVARRCFRPRDRPPHVRLQDGRRLREFAGHAPRRAAVS